jgi:hypothetical protein
VQSAYRSILAQASETGNARRMFVACGRQAIHPLAQAEGLSGLFSVKAGVFRWRTMPQGAACFLTFISRSYHTSRERLMKTSLRQLTM